MSPVFGSKQKEKPRTYGVPLHAEDPEKCVSYINLTILDASEAVRTLVKSKIQEKRCPPSMEKFKARMADKIASVAASKVPPSTIANALSKKLPKKLMYKMYQEMGMRLAAQTVFVEDSFVVMQLQVQYVDSTKLVSKLGSSSSKEESKANDNENDNNNNHDDDDDDDDDDSVSTAVLDEWLEAQSNKPMEPGQRVPEETKRSVVVHPPATTWKESLAYFLEWIIKQLLPDYAVKSLEEHHLPAIVQAKITASMQDMMKKKLAKKHLKADVAVLTEQEQARYFFSNLHRVRSRKMEKSK